MFYLKKMTKNNKKKLGNLYSQLKDINLNGM